MFACVANAGFSGMESSMEHPQLKATGSTGVDVSPYVEQPVTPEIANGGQVLPAPAGPPTEAEKKADSALACMDKCSGLVTCENQCIATTYNVALGSPPPVVSATVPAPIGATATNPANGSGSGSSSAKGSIGARNTEHAGIYQMASTVVAVAIASFFTGL
ncbi:hypothetical protein BGX28_008819 [Mortierella sp. GBA30]|nr:hypothetical protein BGX28_008819 [Mortierella sp. GBA30]